MSISATPSCTKCPDGVLSTVEDEKDRTEGSKIFCSNCGDTGMTWGQLQTTVMEAAKRSLDGLGIEWEMKHSQGFARTKDDLIPEADRKVVEIDGEKVIKTNSGVIIPIP